MNDELTERHPGDRNAEVEEVLLHTGQFDPRWFPVLKRAKQPVAGQERDPGIGRGRPHFRGLEEVCDRFNWVTYAHCQMTQPYPAIRGLRDGRRCFRTGVRALARRARIIMRWQPHEG